MHFKQWTEVKLISHEKHVASVLIFHCFNCFKASFSLFVIVIFTSLACHFIKNDNKHPMYKSVIVNCYARYAWSQRRVFVSRRRITFGIYKRVFQRHYVVLKSGEKCRKPHFNICISWDSSFSLIIWVLLQSTHNKITLLSVVYSEITRGWKKVEERFYSTTEMFSFVIDCFMRKLFVTFVRGLVTNFN